MIVVHAIVLYALVYSVVPVFLSSACLCGAPAVMIMSSIR